MTPGQRNLIHAARKALSLTDAAYRTVLRSVAKVESSTDLDNAGFERVMAVFEEQGYHHPSGDHYWRTKVARQGATCGDRMVRYLEELVGKTTYRLPGLCLRFSSNRTNQVGRLTPTEAWQLAEMLKAAIARTQNPGCTSGASSGAQASLFPQEQNPGCTSGADAFGASSDALTEEEVPF